MSLAVDAAVVAVMGHLGCQPEYESDGISTCTRCWSDNFAHFEDEPWYCDNAATLVEIVRAVP